MYKTIRHGENSLQYTILPQNDDFRIEGKLSSAESNCSRRTKKLKRPKRRSFFAYLGLIFVCTVIVGAVLIPFLVSAECLPSPTEWFEKTKTVFRKSVLKDVNTKTAYNKSNIKTSELLLHEQQIDNSANIGKTVNIVNKNGIEQFVLHYNKSNMLAANKKESLNATQSAAVGSNNTVNNAQVGVAANRSNAQPIGAIDNFAQEQVETTTKSYNEHLITEIRFKNYKTNNENALDGMGEVAAPTIIVTTMRSQLRINNINADNEKGGNIASIETMQITNTSTTTRPAVSLSIISNVINPPRAPANTVNNQNTSALLNPIPTITTRIIQVPLLKAAAKKQIIPPVLVKTSSKQQTQQQQEQQEQQLANNGNANDLAIANAAADGQNKSTWMQSHWPYIDASPYFQWTGYKAENSVLLPAILGFALIGIILSITVCLVARNKRTIVSSVKKRNRNDIEDTGTDDNATLLTTTNLSDED